MSEVNEMNDVIMNSSVGGEMIPLPKYLGVLVTSETALWLFILYNNQYRAGRLLDLVNLYSNKYINRQVIIRRACLLNV